MHRLLYTFVLLLIHFEVSYCQNAYWVSTVKSNGFDDCNDMYVDAAGNVYVTGQIEYTASFDGYHLSSAGSHDMFVAKYDSSGTLLWAKRAGGSDGDIGLSIAVDYLGNSYICGEFETTSRFDGITKIAQGSNNIFVAKYDPFGNAVWVKSIGTNSGSTKGYAVTCDSSGNVYASGTVTARAYYSGSTLFSSRGSEDILVIKFDTYGNYKWFKQIGGSGSDHCFGLAVKGDYLYVTGSFESTAKFSSSVSLHSDGGKDFFIAQYDTTGTLEWAQKGGGSSDDIGWDVTVNTNGVIVCTGEFRHTGDFGNNSINSDGVSDVFITAYDTNGNNLWAKAAGGNEIDYGKGLSHDAYGNLFISGVFTDDATFDQSTINGVGAEDVFFASYDSSGNFRFVNSYGGPNHDRANATGVDKYGNLYLAGEFRSSISFDSLNITAQLIYDGYIVRFGNYPSCSVSATISNDITCFNNCDGAATLTPVGMPPFIYEWLLLPQLHSNYATNLCAGSYPVDVTDGYGCIMSTVVDVPQPFEIEINNPVIQNATCIGCTDGSIQIDVTGGVAPYNFLWSDGNTSEDRINIHSGFYNLCITDSYGCMHCDSFNVLDNGNGVNYFQSNSEIKIFPNPVLNDVNVHVNNAISNGEYLLELNSSIGEKLKTIPVTSNDVQFSIENFPNGIYFLTIVDRKNSEIKYVTPVLFQH